VLLAGGVVNSPQLLMLSGIGAADELRSHGITVRVDLPGVGKNLQDHISAGVFYQRTTTSPFVRQMRLDRLAIDIPMAYLFGKGPATQYPVGPMGFLRLDSEQDVPGIQILFGAGPLQAYPWFPLLRPAFPDVFGCRAILLHPGSRGHLALGSANPHDSMRIRQHFFSDPRDLKTLRDGVRLVREILNQPALAEFRGDETAPGRDVTDDEDLDKHITKTCITVHHPLGTCRMGGVETAVVDGDLKVKGVEGVRVVDASVMPDLVSGNINAAVTMIAEKAADMIRGREPLLPQRP
jgi:choline dehydrogenase-like flavoprotein